MEILWDYIGSQQVFFSKADLVFMGLMNMDFSFHQCPINQSNQTFPLNYIDSSYALLTFHHIPLVSIILIDLGRTPMSHKIYFFSICYFLQLDLFIIHHFNFLFNSQARNSSIMFHWCSTTNTCRKYQQDLITTIFQIFHFLNHTKSWWSS